MLAVSWVLGIDCPKETTVADRISAIPSWLALLEEGAGEGFRVRLVARVCCVEALQPISLRCLGKVLVLVKRSQDKKEKVALVVGTTRSGKYPRALRYCNIDYEAQHATRKRGITSVLLGGK